MKESYKQTADNVSAAWKRCSNKHQEGIAIIDDYNSKLVEKTEK